MKRISSPQNGHNFDAVKNQNASRSVSRVLSAMLRKRDDHSSGTVVTDRLKQPTRMTGLKKGPKPEGSRHPYSVLLPVGFARPRPLPSARCALTAPFHPDLGPKAKAVLFSVALSLGSPPPAINRHRFSMEPGLSSQPRRVSDRPTDWQRFDRRKAPEQQDNSGA